MTELERAEIRLLIYERMEIALRKKKLLGKKWARNAVAAWVGGIELAPVEKRLEVHKAEIEMVAELDEVEQQINGALAELEEIAPIEGISG